MRNNEEQWTAVDIFKARVLDAWDKFPVDEEIGDIDIFLDNSTDDCWELTDESRAFVEQARRDGVL